MALIDDLIAELAPGLEIPSEIDKPSLFRGLMAVQEPREFSKEFYKKQDLYLAQERARKGVTHIEALSPIQDNLYLWQGDITTLAVDGIVNAANSQLLGCFIPNHRCIDNAIHCQAGLQLRMACADLMAEQGHLEATGQAKITLAFNLPSRYVLHTVGPIIEDKPSLEQMRELASCYQSCLTLAMENGLKSIAFCCISTGEFHFPNDLAAQIVIKTVKQFCKNHPNLKVVFNVFKEEDLLIYQKLLS